MNLKLKKFEYLFKRRWYIQSFNCTPNLLARGAESGVDGCWEHLGYGYTHFLNFYKDDFGKMYYDRDDLHFIADTFMAKLAKDPGYLKKLVKTSSKYAEEEYQFCHKVEKMRLYKLSDKELIDLYHQVYYYDVRPISVSHLIEGFALTTDIVIKNQLLKELDKIGRQSEFIKIFNILTQPIREAFFNQENEQYFKIIKEIKKQKLLRLFNYKNSREIIKKLSRFPKLQKMFNYLQENFYWIHNNYGGTKVLTLNHFIKEVKKAIKDDLKYDRNIFKKNQQNKEKIFKKYKFSKKLIQLIKITDVMTYWQDDRKKAMLIACHYEDKCLKEMGRRLNIPLELMRYTIPGEITLNNFLKINKKELQKRKKGCLVISQHKKIIILTGQDYQVFKQGFTKQRQEDDIKELNGLCAAVGKVAGRVRICQTVKDIASFKKGDVLVAPMTRPEYVPAMKKAIAIVTDEGGITSHAAIVSRELNKPCIIGTQIATRVLKSGDKVEVNANQGLVKIIK